MFLLVPSLPLKATAALTTLCCISSGGILDQLPGRRGLEADELLSPGSSISRCSDRPGGCSRQASLKQQRSEYPLAIQEEPSDGPSVDTSRYSDQQDTPVTDLLNLAAGEPVDVSNLWSTAEAASEDSNVSFDTGTSQSPKSCSPSKSRGMCAGGGSNGAGTAHSLL